MSAQPGGSATLNYTPQGAHQSGAAALLSYGTASATRRVVASVQAPWGASHAQAVEMRAPSGITEPLDATCTAPWAQGAPLASQSRAPWVLAQVVDAERSAPWQQFVRRLHLQPRAPWGVARKTDAQERAPWGQYAHRPAITAVAVWQRPTPADQQSTGPWGQFARRPVLTVRPVWGTARRADLERWIPWVRFGRTLDAGWGVVTPPGGPDENENGTIVVPVRTVYIMVNEATLTRVDDGTALPALSLSFGTDVDSWAWRVDASLPATSLDAVMPGMDGQPVLLQAVINGHAVQFLAESIGRDRSFGKSRINVSGRSQSALLADPFAVAYSYSSASAITAQQAAINAVTEAGLPLDWSIDWGIDDWLLPAGLWQHQGTPLSAVQRIAEAAGAYVQTDMLLKTLRVRSRYPAAPWNWPALTPDIILPIDVALREGVEWADKPAYNEVYVRGEAVGVLGHIVKTGTTGGLAAATVIDDLITHADAARQRGRAILSDTGRQQRITLSLPINDDTGLLEVGQLIDINETVGAGVATRRGLVRSVSATCAIPTARQNIEVQVHG